MSKQSLKRWQNRELPEAERLPPNQRWKLNEHIYRQQIGLSTMQLLPFAIVAGVLVGLVPTTLADLFSKLGLPGTLALPIVVLAVFGVQISAMFWYYKNHGQRIVWRALNACDCRTCEACGYDCRATPMDHCPECGASLAKAAAFVEPPDEPNEPTR